MSGCVQGASKYGVRLGYSYSVNSLTFSKCINYAFHRLLYFNVYRVGKPKSPSGSIAYTPRYKVLLCYARSVFVPSVSKLMPKYLMRKCGF